MISDRRFRVFEMVLLGMGIVTVAFLIALTILRYRDSATLSAQRAISERSDCARTITNHQSEIINARDNLVAQGLVAVADGDDPRLAEVSAKLEDAIDAVEALPKTQAVVEQECPNP